MSHFLHFGPGKNELPAPWQNLDGSHDIRKKLRFEDGSASVIMAEHVIEHVPYKQALGFFAEALRVLEPGGVLRVSFPDVSRFLAWFNPLGPLTHEVVLTLDDRVRQYARALEVHLGAEVVERTALWLLLTGWGHEMAWSRETAGAALLVVGYADVQLYDYGRGRFGEFDGHHKDVGLEIATLETTVIEATK